MDIDEIQNLRGHRRDRRLHAGRAAAAPLAAGDQPAPRPARAGAGRPPVRTHARPCAAHRSGPAFLPHAEAALAALKDGQEAVRGLQPGLQGSGLARPGRHPCRHAHRRRAAPLRAPREGRAAGVAHRLERRSDRPGAARRGDARPALLQQRPRRTRRARSRQRGDAGGRGRDHRLAGRRMRDARDARGRALDRLSAVARRARFIGPSAGAPARSAPAWTAPTSP